MITARTKPIPAPTPALAGEQSAASDDTPTETRRREGAALLSRFWDRSGRAVGVSSCLGLLLWTLRFGHLQDSALLPLLLFFTGLSLLSVVLPASGPRGQRVGLIPAVGLAALLLLPPSLALLPLLLANTAYAFSRDAPLSRRGVYERGVWLLLAVGAGGLVRMALGRDTHWPAPVGLCLASVVYGGVYVGGRLASLARHFHAERTVRRHAWASWRLEAVTLAAGAPVALLMALAYPGLGLIGVVGAACLLALLLLVAHFGFEVAGLRDQVRAMEKISAVTVSQTSAPKVIERFLQLSGGLVSCDRVAFWLTDDSQTRLDRLALAPARGVLSPSPPASVRFGEGLVGRVAERRQPLIVRDGARDPRRSDEERRAGETPFSLLLLPLVAGDETIGVAQFERDAPGIWTGRELSRVRALASQAAATLANVRSHQDVYNQAVTDSLTGLFNKRHMQTALADERRRAQRYGHPLSVVMLDVDSFKPYNDTYGHVQGDVLLRMLADLLRENVRGVDIVGRFGGEEFIVLMPETTRTEAYQTAERLRRSVAETVFPGFADDPGLAVFKTISLGVATFPDDTDDTAALVSLADSALYRAKNSGKNRTVVSGPSPPDE